MVRAAIVALALLAASATASAYQTVRVVGAAQVNIRSGPGTDHPASSVAIQGEQARTDDNVDNPWVFVMFPDGRKGYMRSLFLIPHEISSPQKVRPTVIGPLSKASPKPSVAVTTPNKNSEFNQITKEHEALVAKNRELEEELAASQEKLRQLLKLNEEQTPRMTNNATEGPFEEEGSTLSEVKALRAEVSLLERKLRFFEKELSASSRGRDLPMRSIRDHLGTTLAGIGILMVGCVIGARYVRWKDKVERTRLHF